MAKYDPLEAHLSRCGEEELELGFAEVERIMGGVIPPSASRPQWWANETRADGHVQCRAWQSADYDAFLLPRSRVLFRKRAG